MPSICPKQYMDVADIRMLREILKRSGYQWAKDEVKTKRSRAAAKFLIGQFRAGTIEPSSILHKLEHRTFHPRRAGDSAGLQARENEGGAISGVPICPTV